MLPGFVELLSNLTWIVIALALWVFWLAQRPRREADGRSRISVQLTALAVLCVILLPVISVTDDLQASHNPAEVERTSLRNDQHLLQPDGLPQVPALLAGVIRCLLIACPRAIAFLNPPGCSRPEQFAQVRVQASRPPPAA